MTSALDTWLDIKSDRVACRRIDFCPGPVRRRRTCSDFTRGEVATDLKVNGTQMKSYVLD